MSEDRDREVIKREAVGTIEGTGDGRTLDLRIVPWNTRARVTDNGRDFYDEEWVEGCFDRMENAPNRVDVLMNFEHERGIGGVIGRGTDLRNETDGEHGTFRMLSATDADKALELVNEGVLTGVSLEAEPIKTERIDGVVRRVKARLVNVALCRSPAFTDAQVLAVRQTTENSTEAGDVQNLTKEQYDRLRDLAKRGVIEDTATIAEVTTIFQGSEVPQTERSDLDEVLARIGYEPLVSRTVIQKPWDPSPDRFDDEQYERSCLIDRGGEDPVKDRCSLPVLEPNGDINAAALPKAATRLNQVSGDTKAVAARKLIRYFNHAGLEPTAALRSMASR